MKNEKISRYLLDDDELSSVVGGTEPTGVCSGLTILSTDLYFDMVSVNNLPGMPDGVRFLTRAVSKTNEQDPNSTKNGDT